MEIEDNGKSVDVTKRMRNKMKIKFRVISLCYLMLIILFLPVVAMASELHVAAGNGDLNLVKKLVQNGASVNEKITQIGSPLHIAAQKDHAAVAKYLIENGAQL